MPLSLKRAFQRFIERREAPNTKVCYNFKTFKLPVVKKPILTQEIRKRFFLPGSPCLGTFYERLMRSVKVALKKALGKALITYEELATIICEIGYAINTNPLVYTSEDDLENTLTQIYLIGKEIFLKI